MIIEFDTPLTLLKEKCQFYDCVEQTGITYDINK